MSTPTRCRWPGDDPQYCAYHDEEWGVPVYDSRALFEKLILDGFQAGLSWITILRRRDKFLDAFDSFDPVKIAAYGEADIDRLMNDSGIIRNRQKILSTIKNAKLYLEIEAEKEGAFSALLWSFTNGKPLHNHWSGDGDVPATSPESEHMSKALKKMGFGFCGPTICYAFMQAVGMVNDHITSCYRHQEVMRL
ncbi:DNA-3-methyladenine glycosylase I [Emcibacter nanhaiensis]|uniref:DNA-3-methyladenine glycosylase I n=1 Tax=Emcibacter nanhaiensis TaxID=1505037 RepID=A0A501PC29_9PROT|nr:DNA-3-methyladenine glycosylase I [Emcibacter nanhaiensis]TPD57572.1 DNA-3-methyladenine glycosylase I [Emcibacter nanhaiensis]